MIEITKTTVLGTNEPACLIHFTNKESNGITVGLSEVGCWELIQKLGEKVLNVDSDVLLHLLNQNPKATQEIDKVIAEFNNI